MLEVWSVWSAFALADLMPVSRSPTALEVAGEGTAMILEYRGGLSSLAVYRIKVPLLVEAAVVLHFTFDIPGEQNRQPSLSSQYQILMEAVTGEGNPHV